jgi:hypothetical protein
VPLNLSPVQRLERFVTVEDRGYETSCWIYNGRLNDDGYGTLCVYGRKWLVHRLSYVLFCGDITDETIDHLCRQRSCIQPEHLEPKSFAANAMAVKRVTY